MLKESPLGQKTTYIETYTPSLLYPIPRTLGRNKIGLTQDLPFTGVDLWNGFELSWLNPKGKPEIAVADFSFSYNSPFIVESKSFKLYLNSFNQSKFSSFEQVQQTLKRDLEHVVKSPVNINFFKLSDLKKMQLEDFTGICLDNLDIETDSYNVDCSHLKTHHQQAQEALYSDLLKSNCLATGQPDWGSILIRYSGKKIDHAGLLKYLISFRNHSGFAEHCVEQIYCDLLKYCKPDKLTVYARYTRRGGLDINPFRSNFEEFSSNLRQTRQ